MSIEQIKQEGLGLAPADRRELAYFLLDSLILQRAEEDELSEEWKTEVERRWQGITSKTDELISGKELSQQLTERFGIQIDLP
ncbi:MAG: addiction module protein [Bacteroidota bacterium]